MKLKHAPNALCLLRIALVGVLWVLALVHREPRTFGIVLACAYFTDAIDGYLARKYHLETSWGAWIDSVADNLLALSLLPWVWLLLPDLLTQNWPLIGLVLGGFAVSLSVQLVRFRRLIPLHLYSNKVGMWLIALFLVHAFLFGPNRRFMYVTAAALGFSLIEGIALMLTRRDVDETVRSAFERR